VSQISIKTETLVQPTKKTARIAGAIYLTLVVTGPFTLVYIPDKLIVRGDAGATASNVLAHQTLFGLGILGDAFTEVIFICLAFALYRLLRGVNHYWAKLMVGFVLVSAAVGFVNALNNVAAGILIQGAGFLAPLGVAQRNALAMLFIRLHGQGHIINEIFWGLWLFPFGYLVFRSGFLPRILGIWLMIACFGWLVMSVTALCFTPYYDIAFKCAQPILLGEVAIMLWLLIRGVKARPLLPSSLEVN
jgi:Domain of unknown function (DUF4386)